MTTADASPVPDYQDKLRLDDRGFVVIGAGQGIGRQVAHALAGAGARLVCVDNEADRAEEIAAEVGGTPWAGDARERPQVEQLVSTATTTLGRVDGVVDIVGMANYQSLLDIDDEGWAWQQDIVLRHAWLAMQLFGRVMADHGGTMAFVASVSGITGAPMHASYGAAKAGLIALVRSAAVELGPLGIRVNAVAPGVVWTPRVSAFLGEEGRQRNLDNVPLRNVATPSDIAAALLFLSSDLSAFISGQTLVVDGGVSAKFPYPLPEGVS